MNNRRAGVAVVRKYAVDTRRLGIARPCDRRLISYDIEMTEVTGGTFWKPYTAKQIAGTEPYPVARPHGAAARGSMAGADAAVGDAADEAPALRGADDEALVHLDMSSMLDDTKRLMSWRGPIDLGNGRLRALARAIGPSWVRVSGSWATGTYYDFDGHTGGVAPKPYRAVLTRDQWEGVLDFVRAVRGKLLVSFAVVPGLGNAECRDLGGTGAWDPAQVRLLFDAAAGLGVPVSAVEFCNEPNISFMGAGGSDGAGGADGTPYVPAGYARDQDAFYRMMRREYPGVLLVGPCGAMDPVTPELAALPLVRAMGDSFVTSERLLEACLEMPGVFSYHIYGGVSERGAAFGRHWDADEATSDAALDVADAARRYYEPLRDRFCPGSPLWVTESGDANCGGNTWGSTFLDVFRQADELARFAQAAPGGVLFHNTLASSDYGLLDQDDFSPRPNWWLLWLWRRLVGNGTYDPRRLGISGDAGHPHVYAFAREGHVFGVTLVAINNSQVDELVLDLPTPSERFTLSAATAPAFGFVSTSQLRSGKVLLNGELLRLGERDRLPNLSRLAVCQPRGKVTLQPGTVSFLCLRGAGRK